MLLHAAILDKEKGKFFFCSFDPQQYTNSEIEFKRFVVDPPRIGQKGINHVHLTCSQEAPTFHEGFGRQYIP